MTSIEFLDDLKEDTLFSNVELRKAALVLESGGIWEGMK